MSVYLKDIPLTKAKAIFQDALEENSLWQICGIEELPLDENVFGRVLAEPIFAKISSPHYHASAMDGFAIKAEDTMGALPSKPITLKYNEQTIYLDTGDPLPEWANAVIPIEQVESLDINSKIITDIRKPAYIRIRTTITPWMHVRPMGEDYVSSQLVLPAGQVLRSVDLGAIAAAGHSKVRVSKKPHVAILPTGTELIPIGSEIRKGDIIEYNSIVLASQVNSWGGEAYRYLPTPDNFDVLLECVQQAANKNDLVLINAGSSAGSEDYSARVVETLGTLLVHGVAVRPGHPVILGLIKRTGKGYEEKKVPIIGIPGYPVSAALTGEIFVEPLISCWLGRRSVDPFEISASLTRKITSPAGDDDYVRVLCGRVGERILATPLARGAGVISSMVKADGIIILPRGVQGLESGANVKVRLYRSMSEIERSLFIIGSHDMTLDLLTQYLSKWGIRLISANVGSVGGLIALSRGEAHLAGTHLLDPETGEYNVTYIKQYLSDTPVQLITWAKREQGLLVLPGNPKSIRNLEDLVRNDVTFTNRQRGAGTRVLLDYYLQRLNIIPESIHGYNQEEFTHLAVAAAVASGRSDCGLAVAAAAGALNLDFIPLFQERYDIVIPCQFLSNGYLNPVLEIIRSSSFKRDVSALPGYDVSDMGKVVISNCSS